MNRSRVLRSVAAAAASVALLAGCSGGLGPGDAAKVGDRTVTMTQVDRAAEGVCFADAEELEAQGRQLANVQLRQSVANVLAVRALADILADEHGVEAGADYTADRSRWAAGLANVPEDLHEDTLDAFSAQTYVQSVIVAVGEQALAAEGEGEVSQDEAGVAGNVLFNELADSTDMAFDPRLGLVAGETGMTVDNTVSSRAVSFAALQGEADAETGALDPAAEWLTTLPSSQRCG